jgi:hypothetical protein
LGKNELVEFVLIDVWLASNDIIRKCADSHSTIDRGLYHSSNVVSGVVEFLLQIVFFFSLNKFPALSLSF